MYVFEKIVPHFSRKDRESLIEFPPVCKHQVLEFYLGMDIDDLYCNIQSVHLPTKSAIYVWGYNQCGQTGRKGRECHLRIPKRLHPKLFGCSEGANSRWLDIACGREHTAAVSSDGSLFTWGLSLPHPPIHKIICFKL